MNRSLAPAQRRPTLVCNSPRADGRCWPGSSWHCGNWTSKVFFSPSLFAVPSTQNLAPSKHHPAMTVGEYRNAWGTLAVSSSKKALKV